MARPADNPSLSALRARIAHLRQEHGPLLEKIVADGGMSETVRSALVEHLRAEEQEVIEQIRHLAPELAASFEPGDSTASPAAEPTDPRLTVGSLRQDTRPPGRPRAALRAPAAPSGERPLVLGSLRRR